MIELKNVSKTYKTGVTALKDINLTIKDGEFCFIVGRSGSGKSTLVRLLTKELDPDYGTIVVNDTDLKKLRRRHIPKYRRRLGVVYQDFRLLTDRTVYENIAFAQLIIGKSNAEIRENVNHIMELTGISSKTNSYPRQLSGGEQQRTAIARALVNRPELLIADEPTGNLDHENALEVMKLLDRINQQGTTVIVITHDREMVAAMKKRTVKMSMGEIISDITPSDSISTPDTHPSDIRRSEWHHTDMVYEETDKVDAEPELTENTDDFTEPAKDVNSEKGRSGVRSRKSTAVGNNQEPIDWLDDEMTERMYGSSDSSDDDSSSIDWTDAWEDEPEDTAVDAADEASSDTSAESDDFEKESEASAHDSNSDMEQPEAARISSAEPAGNAVNSGVEQPEATHISNAEPAENAVNSGVEQPEATHFSNAEPAGNAVKPDSEQPEAARQNHPTTENSKKKGLRGLRGSHRPHRRKDNT